MKKKAECISRTLMKECGCYVKPLKDEGEGSERTVTLNDCLRKEKLNIRRVRGDLEFRSLTEDDYCNYLIWFQVKKPIKKNMGKAIELMVELKKLLERQE